MPPLDNLTRITAADAENEPQSSRLFATERRTMAPVASVVNLRSAKYDVYIGRKRGERYHFGNPFSHLPNTLAQCKVHSRDASIEAFRLWLDGTEHCTVEPDRRLWILANLDTLRGKVLGCYCKPLDCHGDIYLELLASQAYTVQASNKRWLQEQRKSSKER